MFAASNEKIEEAVTFIEEPRFLRADCSPMLSLIKTIEARVSLHSIKWKDLNPAQSPMTYHPQRKTNEELRIHCSPGSIGDINPSDNAPAASHAYATMLGVRASAVSTAIEERHNGRGIRLGPV